jgi:uncharacterized repeat protein (TIGR03803 family)
MHTLLRNKRRFVPSANTTLDCLASVAILCVSLDLVATAQVTFQPLSFQVADGSAPQAVWPVQGLDGSFYLTTGGGGAHGYGTVVKIGTSGTMTPLYSFCSNVSGSGVCLDGAAPATGLVLARDGNFYGTTPMGGTSITPTGTIFQVTPAGALTTIHNFCTQGPPCSDGAQPYSFALMQATDGNLYGTTTDGGAPYGVGTVFKTTLAGALTTLHSFCASGSCTDGRLPYGGLVQATNGVFYGTTQNGGDTDYGTVFKITATGGLTRLYSFSFTDGAGPRATLIQASDGNLYGTTTGGGTNSGGTIFKMTPAGVLTTLYNFCAQPSCADGSNPNGPLVQATDGNFYGMTNSGGANLIWGTIYQFTPAGVLTTLYSFSNGSDGGIPQGGLTQGTDGDFYGATATGGSGSGQGTVFKLSIGLGPFVKALPTSGRVGAKINILGTGLTGTTSVSFHGKAATFTVVSDSEISTTVPAGANSGKVQVTTPGGSILSNVPFRVIPVITAFSPASGPAGTIVTITGETLNGASSVSFGGVKATSFTVNSYTQITATVPAGAVTGRITVATPGGTATSAGVFTVN